MENLEIKIVSGATLLHPRTAGHCTIEPQVSPYFQGLRCRISCVDPRNPGKELDVKIGAVTVGGSPQLTVNSLTPDAECMALHPSDIEYVNWSVFSTCGLARELQIKMYNPHDYEVAVFICIEGLEVHSLDDYYASEYPYGSLVRTIQDKKREKFISDWMNSLHERSGAQHASTNEITLNPGDQDFLPLFPTVSPYIEPGEIKFHGHKISDSEAVPFAISEVICGSRFLLGTIDPAVFVKRGLIENPADLAKRLTSLISAPGTESTTKPHGVLSSHLVEKDGWRNISKWPLFSTIGLGRSLGIIVYNPWSFPIRVRSTFRGNAVTSLRDNSKKVAKAAKKKKTVKKSPKKKKTVKKSPKKKTSKR